MFEKLVALPDPLKALLAVGVTFLVTEFLKVLSAAVGRDLSGYSAQVSSAVVASLLVLADALLSHIPAEFEPIAGAILNLVVVLLGSWGAYKFYRQLSPRKK